MPQVTFEFFSKNGGSLTHTVDHTYVSADGTMAIMVGQYDLTVDKLEVVASGTYQFGLSRVDGEWKILTDMYNQHAAE